MYILRLRNEALAHLIILLRERTPSSDNPSGVRGEPVFMVSNEEEGMGNVGKLGGTGIRRRLKDVDHRRLRLPRIIG
jgi:hypothetical protein